MAAQPYIDFSIQEVAKSIKNIAEGALGGVISKVLSGPELLELLSMMKT